MPDNNERIAIIGIGSILMLDEGLGPCVAAELLKRYEFPENVAVLDRGTMGMQLLSEFSSCDVVLVVDAVDNTGNPPGTVVRFAPEDLARYDTFHGAHDTRFIDVLDAAELLGYRPEGHCLGVQVENMSPAELTIGLTPAVAAAVPLVLYSVLDFLCERGIEVIDRKTRKPWDGLTVEGGSATEDGSPANDPCAGAGAVKDPRADVGAAKDALARLPRISLGALFMPAVWGPAHGQWIAILFYPLWIFADTSFSNAILYGGFAIPLAVTVFIGTALIMLFFAATAGKQAYLRVASSIPLERFLKQERIWVFVSLGIAIVFLVLATWYNIAFRIPAGMVLS